ncbi:MAG: ATP-binding protein [Anaerolineae bacterium]
MCRSLRLPLRLSLRLKLLLSHLILIVLAMGLAGVLLLTFLERYFLEATEESLAAQAQLTAQVLIPGAVIAGPAVESQAPAANALQQRQLSNLALQAENLALPSGEAPQGDLDLGYLADSSLQLGAQLETRIRILDATGTVLVDSDNAEAGRMLSDDPLVAEALTGQYVARQTMGSGDPRRADLQRMMAVAMPVLVENGLVGVVYLTQPLDDVTTVLGDLRARWLWSTAIALLLSGAVGLVLSRAITRPLHQLTAAAGAVAQGQFDAPEVGPAALPLHTKDELGRLGRAFADMTQRLRAARQMQTTFVANVSHELRTPLTAIKGMVETLRAGAVDDVTVRDRFLATVESETDRLIRLVNDLMVLTRADTEALNLRRETLDLVEVARAICRRMAPQAEARDITLAIEADPPLPMAWADRDRVAQVLINLLDNAIKYSHPGGRVVVRLAPDGETDGVMVAVQDQGIGIPAEDLPHIGERFYRADKARARARTRARVQEGAAQSGSGLGLSIAEALVEAHGGRLWVESEEGTGTTVRFSLPGA